MTVCTGRAGGISGNAKLTGNTASRWGGAICLRSDANGTSTINMSGSEISGNKANSEGGAVHVTDKNCTLTLSGGKLTGNTSGDGGAVYLNQEPSVLNMTGGEISGNTATGSGGGVYIYRSGSVCNLSGGKIEKNTAKTGGGIYISPNNNGQLRLSAVPVVTGNTVSGKANNVYLPSGKTLTIDSAITDGACVGVTTENKSYPVAFSNVYGTDYTDYFASDDAGAHVEYREDQRLYLVTGASLREYHVTVEIVGSGTAYATPVKAAAGTEITLTAAPAAGYHFTGWSMSDSSATIENNNLLLWFILLIMSTFGFAATVLCRRRSAWQGTQNKRLGF